MYFSFLKKEFENYGYRKRINCDINKLLIKYYYHNLFIIIVSGHYKYFRHHNFTIFNHIKIKGSSEFT